MGLGDFVHGVGEAVGNVAKGVAWVGNPTHWDDIAEGVGKGVEFVAEHPGQAWDTAFEVGRAVVKDQLDPVNLAINAGLLAATVATGGAAAPAFVAKLGMGAKSLEAGVAAAKGIETGVEVAKGIDTAVDVAKGVQTGAKALEAGSSALRAGETAAEVGKTVETVADTARTGSKAMDLVDKGLGLGEKGKWMTRAQKAVNPLETSEKFGMAAYRERAAGRILQAGGEVPSLARQGVAAVVQGGGKGLGMVEQLPGMSDKIYEAQKWAQRGQAVGKRLHQADQLSKGVNIAADPMSAVEDRAAEHINANTYASGYTDRGQTTESLYGNSSQVAGPGDNSQLALGRGSQVAGAMYGSGGNGGVPPTGGRPTAAGAAPPPGSRSSSFTQGTQAAAASSQQVTENLYGMDEATSQAASSSHRGMHFWEGPRSQWAGGIRANHDWRPVEGLRPIRTAPGTTRTTYNGTTENTADDAPSDQYMSNLNEQGAPANFSPEVPKSGMYAQSTGQGPVGTGFPTTRFGESSTRSRLRNVTTLTQPIGAIGPGANRTGNAVIDADSSSPDDYGFDNSGQGYFDFGNMGSGTADVGSQPNTSPMYAQGSRTSRRSAGMLGV